MPKTTNQRENILNTALELFALHGYVGASVSMIATEAGISRSLMYNFFESKEELLKEIMRMALTDINNSMTAYATESDPKKAIEGHIRSICTVIKQRSNFWRMLHGIRLQEGVAGILMMQFQEIVANVTETFERVFRQLKYKEPKLEALLFLSQIDGMVILYLQDSRIPIDRLGEQLIKRYVA